MNPPTFALVLCFVVFASQGGDSKRDVPITQRAVDVATLRTGERLLGQIVTGPSAERVKILVRRDWLKRTAPAFQKDKQQVEAEHARLALVERRDRIRRWQKQRPEPRTLAVFLDQELRRVEMQLEQVEQEAPHEPPQLMLVEFPRTQVFSHYLQPPERRRILPLAWEHHLANSEDRSAAALARELEDNGVQVKGARPDLSDRVAMQRETDQEWAARVGLVEYSYLHKPHFQGSGGLLVRADEDAPRPGVPELLAGILQGELAGLLNGNTTKPRGADANAESTALRSADADGFRGARLTQMEHDLAAGRVTVRTRFVARMPSGSWTLVWQHTQTSDVRKARPGQEQIVADDPQIAQVLQQLKQLGVTPDRNTLGTALRVGTATKEAQAAAGTAFEDFLRPATLRLDTLLLLPPESSRQDVGRPIAAPGQPKRPEK